MATDIAIAAAAGGYRLDEQVGFKLRLAYQRHALLFAAGMPEGLTPTQWAVLARLSEDGPSSQAEIARRTAMDAASAKGVVDRLAARGLVLAEADPDDGRRHRVRLSGAGEALVAAAVESAAAVTRDTLAPLAPRERRLLMDLLDRLC